MTDECINEYNKKFLLQEYVLNWLEHNELLSLAVLGDFGSGKTTFARNITKIIAQEYLIEPSTNYLPVKIELRNFPYANGIEDIIQKSMMIKGLEPKFYLPIMKNGRILYILDGLDEMSAQVKRTLVINNAIELGRLALNDNKIIVTSRTHFFKNREDEKMVLNISRPTYNTGFILKPKSDAVNIVYLDGFNKNDIKEYLQCHFSDRWQEFYDILCSIYNLSELSERPILLNLIVQILPELKSKSTKQITISSLYEIVIDNWISRDQWRDIHANEILSIMENFALQLFVNDLDFFSDFRLSFCI
jgi:energy-coupling factor transporter ATP-binding protein EcfA2